MRFLKNPVIVVILAIVALALVFRNAFWPMIHRGGSRPKAAPAATASAPAATSPAKPTTLAARAGALLGLKPADASRTVTNAPTVPMEVSSVWAEAPGWSKLPRRDPFKAMVPAGQKLIGKSAKELLALHGIWRQTDSTLAVLNNTVVEEGEQIQGFTVETIEDNRVWVQGPRGREAVDFALLMPTPGTALPEIPETKEKIAAAKSAE